MRKAEFNNDVYVTHFGINILTNMTEVMGRVLNAPKIQYGGRVRISNVKFCRIALVLFV